MTQDSVYRSDLIGKRYGRLVVQRCIPGYTCNGKSMDAQAWCRCDCGTEKYRRIGSLREGARSCGCERYENLIKRNAESARNGITGTSEYETWAEMKYRCTKARHKSYRIYGGRGIKVCERWIESFANFLSDMGLRPSGGYSLDRINNDGDYEPSNCRWATRKEQFDNSRLRHDIKGRFIVE